MLKIATFGFLPKRTYKMFDKNIYLIGINEYDEKVFLEEPSWDCGWYWGFGYLETYTNNRQITRSRDICSHSHFLDFDENNSLCSQHELKSCVLTWDELQELKRLMKQAKFLGDAARQTRVKEYENLTEIHKQIIDMLTPKKKHLNENHNIKTLQVRGTE